MASPGLSSATRCAHRAQSYGLRREIPAAVRGSFVAAAGSAGVPAIAEQLPGTFE